jgi:isopenicillin-N epimerase
MPVTRRGFLAATGVSTAAAVVLGRSSPQEAAPSERLEDDWGAVRAQFALDPEWTHLGMFFLVSHPRPVREAVERLRRELDANPLLTVEHAMFDPEFGRVPNLVKQSIASYIGGKREDVALAGSTTEALSIVYQGLKLGAGDEILTTDHDHFVHHEAIRWAVERVGASWRRIPLFDEIDSVSKEQMAERIGGAIRPNTRAVGLTWVHSSSGLKTPLREIAAVVARANRERPPSERILLIVDGVHGLGADDPNVAATGIDFFCSGLHKWIMAPRGTGFIWGKPEAWARLRPTIPGFEAGELFGAWMEKAPPEGPPRASWFSYGGFHAFEHQWAIPTAFEFHQNIGPERIQRRIQELNGALKEGLSGMTHVTLHTPQASELSAGIVCFEIDGMEPGQVVHRLMDKRILATTSPYRISYARFSCGIMNTMEEVETALAAVRKLKSA